MNISIKQIKAFLALVEEDNFTRAAQKIHLSQPAFSSLIANLEQEIGYRLFDRDTRKVQLNEDGIHFIKLARELMFAYERTTKEIRSHANNHKEKLVLAVMPSIVVQWVSQLLATFHHKHANVKVELLDTQWDLCLQALLQGHAELALTAKSPSLTEITAEFLFSDKFHLICHINHPLASKADIELKDLLEYGMIGFTKGTSIRHYVDKIVDLFGMNYVVEVSQLTTMMGLVAANYGIGIVPRLTLFQFEHKNLVVRDVKDMNLERSIYLIKHKERKLSPQAENFYHHIKANIFSD
ncbi:LysR family transcriptional regulator [Snodgrassella alvi]|uniref:LysR family transcriptional regulator n=1 Tax=Snodgrassella alvi TaxID=1196083 RepID=UPI003D019B4E